MGGEELQDNDSTRDFWINQDFLFGLGDIEQCIIDGQNDEGKYAEDNAEDEHITIRPKSSPSNFEYRHNVRKFWPFSDDSDYCGKESHQKCYSDH